VKPDDVPELPPPGAADPGTVSPTSSAPTTPGPAKATLDLAVEALHGLHAPISAADDDAVPEHTLERPLTFLATPLHAGQPIDAPPVDDFEDQKTSELSTLMVPVPISMGPRAPIVEGEADGEPGIVLDDDVVTLDHPKAPLLESPRVSLAPATSLYEDPPMIDEARMPAMMAFEGLLPAHLDEKTADIVIQRPPPTRDAGSDEASHVSTDEGATVEGAPLDEQRTDQGPVPPNPGDVLTADDGTVVRLEDSLGEQAGMVFFKARLSTGGVEVAQPFTAVWMPQAPAEPPWERLPDTRLVRPRCRVSLERAAIRVFERPKGNTVVDYLADDDKLLPAMATIELGIELAELLESLHGAGCCIYDLDPSQIVIEKGGRVRLYAVSGLWPQSGLPTGSLGVFCAPEVRRRMGYRVTAAADVYAVALLLYALLARRAPLDIDTDPSFLVTPRVFRPECPLGLWPALRPCLDPNPLRRIGHARGLREQLELARQRLVKETRATEEQTPVLLEGWAEQHAGLAKARRGSGQQDRALSVTDETGRTGLYVIADGVSRSKFGDGAFAAEQVEVAACSAGPASRRRARRPSRSSIPSGPTSSSRSRARRASASPPRSTAATRPSPTNPTRS
jgi:hypothetical protein